MAGVNLVLSPFINSQSFSVAYRIDADTCMVRGSNPSTPLGMLDHAVAETRETNELATAVVEVLFPRYPISPLD